MQELDKSSDEQLWKLVLEGNIHAFEQIVHRHKDCVSAVAYGVCGDFTTSEDISQDTFFAAWKDRRALSDPSRLKAWLCGIARNLARNSNRRPQQLAIGTDTANFETEYPSMSDRLVSDEESSLVQDALRELPELYREPLILYYREDQSVNEVARSLELTEAAVKQRLARGREMIRSQVLEIVERTLRNTKPTARLTSRIMAGLMTGIVGKAASAATDIGTGAIATAAAGSKMGVVLSAGTMGGVGGMAAGLAGGYLGSWIPAQLAPTNTERIEHLRTGRRMLIVALIASVVLFIAILLPQVHGNLVTLFAIIGTWIVGFMTYCLVEAVASAKRTARIRASVSPDSDPNTAYLRRYVRQNGWVGAKPRWRGRRYRSRVRLLGLPLVDIQVSSQIQDSNHPKERGHAVGWIAIGDVATGFLAIGGWARGVIAIGGLTFGFISIGGLAAGGIALGGLAIGWLGIGGLGMGWNALGGLAVAWNEACGGGAIAYHAACGGGALAMEIAMGGGAIGQHANDELAKSFWENHWMWHSIVWTNEHSFLFILGIVLFTVLPIFALMPLLYQRVEGTSEANSNGDSMA